MGLRRATLRLTVVNSIVTGTGAFVGKILPWVLTALLSVAAPIVVYDVATEQGVGEVPALLLGAIGPLLELAITAVWRRRLDEFSTVVLIFLALGVVTSLFLDDRGCSCSRSPRSPGSSGSSCSSPCRRTGR